MKPNLDQLNAYVDGELPVSQRAEVAAAIAHDPEMADRVATLTRLKAAVSESSETELPDALMPQAQPRPWWGVVAASAAVVAAAAGLFLAQSLMDPTADVVAVVAEAAQSHAALLRAEDEGADLQSAGPFAVALTGFADGVAFVPDLSGAKLTVIFHRMIPGTAGAPPRFHVLYGGEHGCRLSVWMAPASGDLDEALRQGEAAGFVTYGWQADGIDYVIVSAIAAARYRLIAETVHRLTFERHPVEPEAVVALNLIHQDSPPCLA